MSSRAYKSHSFLFGIVCKSGCHNDVRNIKQYLIDVQGFPESEMLILMDDGRAHAPTRRNIEDAFARICQYSQDGDIVWVHYSGHGGRVRDVSGDEEDGYDSTLIPVDFRSSGQILDDDGTYTSFFVSTRNANETFLLKFVLENIVTSLSSIENAGQANEERR
jgi:hypothetical protein